MTSVDVVLALAEAQPNDSTTPAQVNPKHVGPRKPRSQRPNYNEIHAKPLPVDVYPLPAFLPHNPISIVRIAIGLISHALFPPRSLVVIHKAYFSQETHSVHVTDPASIRALWEHGFWGKGSLSRSEPQWLAGERKRRGLEETKTSAEVTLSRREERKQFKLERAREQNEAIEAQRRQERKLETSESTEGPVADKQESASGEASPLIVEDDATEVDDGSHNSSVEPVLVTEWPVQQSNDIEATPEDIQDQEHLQLAPEEAFYLAYTLGALQVMANGSNDHSYPAWYLLRLYAAHATSPVHEYAIAHLQSAYQLQDPQVIRSIPTIETDNPFMLRYVVFHHFRSLGWVVRPGIKFAVDYLLYQRGPPFHHAEFAIMIVPSYSAPYWSEAPERLSDSEKNKVEAAKKDWWWLHRVNRVQTTVYKTLVLVYVEVPAPWDVDQTQDGWKVDIGSALKQYTVREVVVRRWSPNRNRD
jgi:tRNA-splicing endonuclease subunit Sen2